MYLTNDEYHKIMKNKDVVSIRNPIDNKNNLFICHARTTRKKLEQKLIEKSVERYFRNAACTYKTRMTVPMCMVNKETENCPALISIGFSFLESIGFYFSMLNHSKLFKKSFDKHSLLHEIAHTSKYQKKNRKDILSEREKEMHSDLFAIYFIMDDFNKEEFDLFLSDYLKFRNSEWKSPEYLYSRSSSEVMVEFFRENKQIKSKKKLSFKEFDKLAFEATIAFRGKNKLLFKEKLKSLI